MAERTINALQEVIDVERLSQQAKSAAIPRAGMKNGLRASSDHDHGQIPSVGIEPVFQIDAAKTGHLNIRYDAPRTGDGASVQEGFCGGEPLDFMADRSQQTHEGGSQGVIVVDYGDQRVGGQ